MCITSCLKQQTIVVSVSVGQGCGRGLVGGSGLRVSPEAAFKIQTVGASLVAQWLKIRLPMQGTEV